MEDNGIKIDIKFLRQLEKKVEAQIKKMQKQIWQISQTQFNINSTQQLRAVLFEKLKISADGISKTKTGLSTAAAELAKLKDRHPIIGLIQEYRELTKLKNTYISTLPKLVNPQTGRLHTSFNQTVTATGRLSSTDPNLQNIPVRTSLGKQIRRAFVAEAGFSLVSLDYSQIELRLAAHMSGDKKMIEAFRHGADIHTATAAEINQVNPQAVTPEMRREAKAINFGILYGQGPHGLAQSADIPYSRAKEFIEQYFLVYGGIKKFIDSTISQAREKGYVQTLFGRRRYLPEINSSIAQVRKAAERMAINTPLQGTAADMIKIAMIRVDEFLQKINKDALHNPAPYVVQGKARLLLQVHDELLLEVKEKEVKKIAAKIKEIMEQVIKLKVPVVVDIKTGKNWGEMEKMS
jgi:DNA polymerase-1